MSPNNLSGQPLSWWLAHIGSVHLSEIDLGLERVGAVARRLGLPVTDAKPDSEPSRKPDSNSSLKPDSESDGVSGSNPSRKSGQKPSRNPQPAIITVAGTNGKGSVVSCLENALLHLDLKVGSYTSPHLERYNQRIRLAATPVADAQICAAFAAIETARQEISLSYFEFSTLAALLIFQQQELDVVILEVGLGGRLDAVNLIDPDIAVITSIALDHQQWLGPDRETIAQEKAGILRPHIPFVCGDPDPPQSLLARSEQLACPLYRVGQEFNLQPTVADCWEWTATREGKQQVFGHSTPPRAIAENAAVALQVLALLEGHPPNQGFPGVSAQDGKLLEVLANAAAPGRQELRRDSRSGRQVLLDVAHNPAAARQLATRLADLKQTGGIIGKVHTVIAVMADKYLQDMAQGLASHTDIWYIAQLDVPRSMPTAEAVRQVQSGIKGRGSRSSESGVKGKGSSNTGQQPITDFASVAEAYHRACSRAAPDDWIVVTGSFHTVAAVRPETVPDNLNDETCTVREPLINVGEAASAKQKCLRKRSFT